MKWENEGKLFLRRDTHDFKSWLLETKDKHGYSVELHLYSDHLFYLFGRSCLEFFDKEIKRGERIEIKLTLEVEDE